MKFNVKAQDGSFQLEYETIDELISDYLGQYSEISGYMYTETGAVITPANKEAEIEVEKQRIFRLKNEFLSNEAEDSGMRSGSHDAHPSICKAIGLSEMDLAVLEYKSANKDKNFYIENDNGRFFMAQIKHPAREHLDELMAVGSDKSICAGSIGRKDTSCIQTSGTSILIIDKINQATSIKDITNRDIIKNTSLSIRCDAYTGDEETPGASYAAFDLISSGDERFVEKIIKEMDARFDGINGLCGHSYYTKKSGFCNSEIDPIVITDNHDFFKDSLKDSQTSIAMMPKFSGRDGNVHDVFNVISIDDKTMNTLGCKDDAKGVCLEFEKLVDGEFKNDKFLLKKGEVYNLKSIYNQNPFTIDPKTHSITVDPSFEDLLMTHVDKPSFKDALLSAIAESSKPSTADEKPNLKPAASLSRGR